MYLFKHVNRTTLKDLIPDSLHSSSFLVIGRFALLSIYRSVILSINSCPMHTKITDNRNPDKQSR